MFAFCRAKTNLQDMDDPEVIESSRETVARLAGLSLEDKAAALRQMYESEAVALAKAVQEEAAGAAASSK